ncbi:MAG: DUF5615 family PIN-like protein [Imperialibacter sp.]|uniref:DUF5615 family PIN-like protein n=1 Tax=Imperialibacter sp. TaxID=2038411 RepID=UPI0032EB9ED8
MILADENLPPRMIELLRGSEIEVFSIKENHRGIDDQEVINLSKSPPRIILTEDKDFGEWVFAHHEESISVILLRYKRPDLDLIANIVIDLIKAKGASLFGKYVTVTLGKIRIREI